MRQNNGHFGGVSKRIANYVADGHYVKILAAGTWAEGLSGHDFDRSPCEEGSEEDRLALQPILLKTFRLPEDLGISTLSEAERRRISAQFDNAYDSIFEAISKEFDRPENLSLLHEIAESLLVHESLPADILEDLNSRYPIEAIR